MLPARKMYPQKTREVWGSPEQWGPHPSHVRSPAKAAAPPPSVLPSSPPVPPASPRDPTHSSLSLSHTSAQAPGNPSCRTRGVGPLRAPPHLHPSSILLRETPHTCLRTSPALYGSWPSHLLQHRRSTTRWESLRMYRTMHFSLLPGHCQALTLLPPPCCARSDGTWRQPVLPTLETEGTATPRLPPFRLLTSGQPQDRPS